MVSLLDSAIKRKVAAAFKGKLTTGIMRRSVPGGLDSNGDASAPTVTTFTFEGIREDFSLYSKANAGIPDTDVAIMVLLGSLVPTTTVKKDDQLYLGTPWEQWYQVRRVISIDPAGATAKYQAYAIEDPTA